MKLISSVRARRGVNGAPAWLKEQRGWASLAWIAACGLLGWAGPAIVHAIAGSFR